MAIEFKDVSEPTAASPTTTVAELPVYQTSAVSENGSTINTTNYPLELTVADCVPRQERNEDSLKYTMHMSQVNYGVIIIKIAEMVHIINEQKFIKSN